jgi:hypothetical protein
MEPLQSSLNYGPLSVSAFLNALQRFRQKPLESVTHDLDDDCLAQCFSFYRLMLRARGVDRREVRGLYPRSL